MPNLSVVAELMEKPYRDGAVSNFGNLFWQVYSTMYALTKRHFLPVTSGTTAIQIALQTVLKPGSNVVIPDFTHIGTLNAVIGARMNPVLAGVLKGAWTLDPEPLKNVKARGVVVVSPFGYNVDSGWYDKEASRAGMSLVYDFAGAWGMCPKTPHPICYSLHATKNFCVGEGGMISFAHREQWERARRMTNFNITPDGGFDGSLGGNHKVDELRCAMILAKLREDDDPFKIKRSARKGELIRKYWINLMDHVKRAPGGGYPSLCVLPGVKSIEKEAFDEGIQMKRYFPLLSQQPFSKYFKTIGASDVEYFSSCMALPSDVTDEEFEKVCEFIRRKG
jgi:hypothetical protein